MNKKTLLIVFLMLINFVSLSLANPFSDVPANHWAYSYIKSLKEKGIIKGDLKHNYNGDGILSRYHLAIITSRLLGYYEQNRNNFDNEDFKKLKSLSLEFADELILLGYKTINLNEIHKEIKKDIYDLKKDVNKIKSKIKAGKITQVKLSGDAVIRNYGFVHDKGANNGEDHRHRTESIFRLQLDAPIDEKVFVSSRWLITGFNGGNLWDGNNKQTSSVQTTYLKVKDMFHFGGDFKFGRDWYSHGHKFVVHNYMDAVGYTKRCGDIDLAFNLFFWRNNDQVAGRDTYNIWNINADYNTKDHNIYFGFYYNEAVRSNADNPPKALPNNEKATRIEFGSFGKIKKDRNLAYDFGIVYSDLKEADEKGILGHVAIDYDCKKQINAKLAYTYADDESNANINVENQNSSLMRDETIFEDIYLVSMAYNAETNLTFKNLRDLKIQLSFTPKNNKRNNYRFAYDYIENIKNNKPNTFNTRIGSPVPGFTRDLKGSIATLDYTYKLQNNTRLRLCYQNSEIKAKNMPNQKVSLYFAEIYCKF